MATNNTRSGFPGQSRPNPGYRDGERSSRDPEPTLDTSGIRFGHQISPNLYSDVAEQAAQQVAKQIGGRDVNKGTQLRRFYDELIMLQSKVGNSEDRFTANAPFVQMLKAKVAYAKGRNKVDANFDRLLRHVVDQIKNPATFSQAKLFMEAFMAFYKVYGPKD
ncbi:MAG: type III-A CRISPR-associated protein Csm2 [Burkholderiales bacterium]|nr:type III-A CRISPR-associated protein Csm2 [Burkholderiales bacterium]